MRKLLCSTLLAAITIACGPLSPGVFDASGFTSDAYDFGVTNTPEGSLLPNDWRLDNLYERGGRLRPKRTPGYMTKFSFDTNGDGTIDRTMEEFAYELRFENIENDGIIWLRTFPISETDRHKKLRVLMKSYIDDASKAGYELVVIGTHSQLVERRFAAKPVVECDVQVAGKPAYEAVVDVSNLDRIKVDPTAVEKRVKLVLVATGFNYRVYSRSDGVLFPVLMLAGYSNNLQDFEAGERVFDQFLDRITINARRGYVPGAKPDTKPDTRPDVEQTPAVKVSL